MKRAVDFFGFFPDDANQERYSVFPHSREFTVGSVELTEFKVFNQIFFSFVFAKFVLGLSLHFFFGIILGHLYFRWNS